MLTPKEMEFFVAVVEEASLTAAAARLYSSQPYLSQTMAGLERRVGVPLLVKDRAGTRPTPAGRELYEQCLKILGDLRAIEERLKPYSGLSGVVRVTVIPIIARSIAALALQRLLKLCPNIEVQLIEKVHGLLVPDVAAGLTDIGITMPFAAGEGYQMTPIGECKEALVMRGVVHRDHMKPLNLSEITADNWIFHPEPNIRRDYFLPLLKSNRIPLKKILSIDSFLATLEFIRTSEFATIYPTMMVATEIASSSMLVRPISELDMKVVAVHRREASSQRFDAVIDAFRTEMQEFKIPSTLGRNDFWEVSR